MDGWQVGSGYLVDTGRVLTAWHCVVDKRTGKRPRNLRVARRSSGDPVTAVPVAAQRDGAAVLEVTAGPGWSVSQRTQFGQLDRKNSGRVDDVEAIGFPLWQTDPRDGHRNAAELRGEIRRTDGWEDGLLVLYDHRRETVAVPPSAASDDKPPGSPWGGLSGALVFWRGIALGIIVKHLPWQGNAAISILPAKRFLEVTDHYEGTVAAALGFPPGYEPPMVADAEDSAEVTLQARNGYLQWLISATGTISVLGWRDAPGAVGLRLDRVYVAMRLRPARPAGWETAKRLLRQPSRNRAGRELAADDNAAGPAQVSGSQELMSIGDVYQRNATTVVLGEPGSGKTTMVGWLAVAHANALVREQGTVRVPLAQVDTTGTASGEWFELGRPLLPVVVRLADYAAHRRQRQKDGNLLEFLGDHSSDLGRPVWPCDVAGFGAGEAIPSDKIAKLIREAVRGGRALIILDGLDEVPTEERDQVAAEISRFIDWWGPRIGPPLDDGNRVLITSRTEGYRSAPLPADLARVTIEPMILDDVRVLSHRWLRAVLDGAGPLHDTPSAAADQLSVDFFAMLTLDHNAGVREVAGSPLFASLLLSNFLNDLGDLPAQRVEVYESILDTLEDRWEKRRLGSYTARHRTILVKALPAVAAHFFATVPSGVFHRDKLSEELVAEVARLEKGHPESPAINAEVESLIDIMRTDVGLLIETEPKMFRFSHRTIQEFLSARDLVSGPRHGTQKMLAHLADPRWRDVILLAIGLINRKHRDKLTTVADELLAAKGPLGELFPEPALVLARGGAADALCSRGGRGAGHQQPADQL